MQIIHNGKRYEAICEPDQYSILESAGFRLDKRTWKYFTSQDTFANKFFEVADPTAKELLRKHKMRVTLSQATDSNVSIPVPDGLDYYGFQRVGILYALNRKYTMIADGMRLGKTVQAAGIINLNTDIDSVLVVTKASLKINWNRELMKWIVRHWCRGGKLKSEVVPAESNTLPDVAIPIINYDNVQKLRREIDKRHWNAVFFDESHYLANPTSQRTKYSLGYTFRNKVQKLPIQADMMDWLTGTPITKRPKSLWPVVKLGDPDGLGSNESEFDKRYCAGWDAPWGWDATGVTKANLPEMQERLRSSFMIRRLKEDVLDQLPPVRRQIIPLPADKVRQVIREEDKLTRDLRREAEAAQERGDEETFNEAVRKLQRLDDVAFEQTSTLRQTAGTVKIPYAIDLLEDKLEEEEKVVVFAHHQNVIEAIDEKFKKFGAVTHYGKRNPYQKQEAVDRFKDDPKCRMFIGSITGAEGYSVAISSYALFVEFDWRATMMEQAEDRLFLLDKVDSLLYQYLVYDGSLDSIMARHYVKSKETTRKALDQ